MKRYQGKHYVPDRGDVVWLDFHPSQGREQSERRPALVLSPVDYNKKARLFVVCPITSQVKGYPFEVAIPNGFPVSGVVLADQVKSFDFVSRRAEFKTKLPESFLREVFNLIAALIDPDYPT